MKANTSEPGWFSTSATTSSAAAWPMVQRPVRTASIRYAEPGVYSNSTSSPLSAKMPFSTAAWTGRL